MKNIEAAGIGVVLGVLYGVTLWASIDALSTASMILYGNSYFIPLISTWVVMLVAFIPLFTYDWWLPYFIYIFLGDDSD